MLTLQFGQCGNQVGHTLFSNIASDLYSQNTGLSSKRNSEYAQSGFDKWFKGLSKNGKHLARAVLIDTEQKVIRRICSDSDSTWAYSPSNVVSCHSGGGSANNWAYGYSTKGSELTGAALEAVRQEIERVDSLEGILALLSSAGGTGSGVGSHVMEIIRDEFTTKTIATAVVLPYASGEVCTQNYNTLLTLAKLNEVSDIIFMFENDQIHSICESLVRARNTSLNDLNNIIGCKLASVLQPVSETTNILSSIAGQITPHPQYKLAAIKTSPLATSALSTYDSGYKWHSIVGHLKQMLRIPALDLKLTDVETKMPSNSVPSKPTCAYSTSVSNMLITRGASTENDPILATELSGGELYADFVPSSQRFSTLHQPRRLLGRDKFSSLVTNNSQLHLPVNLVVERAWNSYVHSAYLHQYKEHGVGEDDFLQAFAKVENLVKVYKELNIEEISP
ncbi:tubulin delta chain-like [Athalia rosae]|uniref:tubulin delta chain-like n=1 Tax=Athalia rosae TaxID=37344 RepID=UPI002033D29B|nr:tubulin delta chain-like [Athalia rosae]